MYTSPSNLRMFSSHVYIHGLVPKVLQGFIPATKVLMYRKYILTADWLFHYKLYKLSLMVEKQIKIDKISQKI